jgi:hypothetical protein
MQDDKHRVKLSKEYQEFVEWTASSRECDFWYKPSNGKWASIKYADKSTIQLYLHFQKNVKKA